MVRQQFTLLGQTRAIDAMGFKDDNGEVGTDGDNHQRQQQTIAASELSYEEDARQRGVHDARHDSGHTHQRKVLLGHVDADLLQIPQAGKEETGETANSWYYKIEHNDGLDSIIWCNSHVEKGCNIAVILQYGHATRNGGYVEGHDYINPALRPIFEDIAREAWKEVRDR